MQFSLVAAALMATVVSAGSTLYVTDVVTITSCAPTVTNCPAESTVTSTTSYIHTTSVSIPSYHNTTSTYTPPKSTSVIAPVVSSSKPYSLSTQIISTCIPTVITSVVTVYPTTTPKPTSTYTPKPTGGASGVVTPYPTFTGAASHVKGSVYAAGLGLAAFLLA